VTNTAARQVVAINRRQDLEVYDSLPVALRRAMADAVLPYAATNALALLRSIPAETVASVIRNRDRKVLDEHRRRINHGLALCQ
jgi:hypothetical protein